MRIDVITVFPEMIVQGLSHSIIGRAVSAGLLDIGVRDLRDFAHDRHRTTDDEPYGGGVGMVMKVEPLDEAVSAVRSQHPDTVVALMCPQGELLNQRMVQELADLESLTLVCGHYEGVDERVRDNIVDREISIGDYVLTGGELPALVIIDAVARLKPGVLGKSESAEVESFAEGLLEYPHYTRPDSYKGWNVPEVLLSGNHAAIAAWRRRQALERTIRRRPDLLAEAALTKDDLAELREMGVGEDIIELLSGGNELAGHN